MSEFPRYFLIPIACLASILGFVQWIPKLLGISKWTNRQDKRSMEDVWGWFDTSMTVREDPDIPTPWDRVRSNPFKLHHWKNINSERVKSDAESGVKVISFVCFVMGLLFGLLVGVLW